jgi:hypothetical protein
VPVTVIVAPPAGVGEAALASAVVELVISAVVVAWSVVAGTAVTMGAGVAELMGIDTVVSVEVVRDVFAAL